jgi:hypothetical protein
VAILHERAQAVRKSLADSSNYFPRVMAVLVTSKGREEVKGGIEQAERLGMLVLTRESLDDAIGRSLITSDADEFYREAEGSINRALSKYSQAG